MTTVAIYARVSDDKKKTDGARRQDVNRQIELLKDHLNRSGITDFKQYIDDGRSGWTDDINFRPAFKQLRNDVLRHFVTHVYVESLDRFSSNLVAGMQWLEQFSNGGAVVISLSDGEYEVTSDTGWMRSAMMLMLSEWRIRNLRSKIKSGMERRKADSRYMCHSCGIVHLGRHPLTCGCKPCKKKRGGKI